LRNLDFRRHALIRSLIDSHGTLDQRLRNVENLEQEA
jgi:hypothetical protein